MFIKQSHGEGFLDVPGVPDVIVHHMDALLKEFRSTIAKVDATKYRTKSE
jgi:hypothetical protein